MANWKRLERKAALALDGQRAITKGCGGVDVIHDRFAVECKYRASMAFTGWYKQAERYAKGTDKIPLLICKQRGQHGEFVILKMEHFRGLIGS